MKHFALTFCLLAIVGFAWANPADRESRQVMPERIPEGVLLLDDGFVGRRQLISDDMIEPLIISTRKFGSIPVVTSDQQAEEQRYPYGGYGGGGWGGGRPYGGGWGGGRPYGGGWGGGRPYGGGGWGGGRPWW